MIASNRTHDDDGHDHLQLPPPSYGADGARDCARVLTRCACPRACIPAGLQSCKHALLRASVHARE
eukprot:14206736-Alexandrium_andersonii.AAC.1